MKVSELWLREWVNPKLNRDDLCERLTMAGLEVEAMLPVAEKFSGVVIAKILRIEKHPTADRLQVCEVDVGGSETLSIVCGANNVTVGMKTAAALDGALLANKMKIKASKFRGVLSQGMLCSAVELGLAEESEGLIILPLDAPVGTALWDYLDLTDQVMDVSITPNRGDCLSVMGLAQDVSALTQMNVLIPNLKTIHAIISDKLNVTLQAAAECPRYVGRIIRGMRSDTATPVWLQERLRRGGIRVISPVVDVLNYVMLELGQPMHAFDLAKIAGEITVRMAKAHETLMLLDGQTLKLELETLIIADTEKPLAIAGVMGGIESAVSSVTKDIFLESAFFQPVCISRISRLYKLNSESSYRFERGVDPDLQLRAMERATQLIIEIAGGKPGPLTDRVNEEYLPLKKDILLRKSRIEKILGLLINDEEIEKILESLGFSLEITLEGWNVSVPARRFDITMEIDLVEEIIRVYGYDKVPQRLCVSGMQTAFLSEKKIYLTKIRHSLSNIGYQEIVSYSFIAKEIQHLFDPENSPKELVNPIINDMSVMRTSLWPGLINTLLYNQNRQQHRVRIFESGLRFITKNGSLLQENVLTGLVCGNVFPEQWGISSREADFFDVKGDIEHILKITLNRNSFAFKVGSHPALHPQQTADLYRDGNFIGTLGVLHPAIAQKLGIQGKVILFELLIRGIEDANLPHFKETSKFPENRRDMAILVDEAIPAGLIQDTIIHVAGELLQDVHIFDVYQGKGIKEGYKSIALSLTLQHPSRTLVDEEVAAVIERVIVTLKENFAAELRG